MIAINDMEKIIKEKNIPVILDEQGESVYLGDTVSFLFNGEEAVGIVEYSPDYGRFEIYIEEGCSFARFGYGEIEEIRKQKK